MYTKRSKITDILIIIILIVIGILLGVSGYFHFNIKKRIYEDSYFINQIGLIRGNIQRYTKFKILNKDNQTILQEVKFTLNNIQRALIEEKKISDSFYNRFNKKLNKIENNIYILETTNDQNRLLEISETLWKECNELMKIALKFHRYKFSQILTTFNILIYGTVIFLIIIILFIFTKVKKGLEVETITDKLTGLYNRLYFNEIYEYFIERYKRNKHTFSMLIIDIDDFKKINDNYGHTTGDEVLIKIGTILKENIRKTDFAFRYGGEEFVIIYPDTEIKKAYEVSKRILQEIPKKVLINLKPITISGGIGEYKGENPKEFFEKVDKALYKAKKSGKNKIVSI